MNREWSMVNGELGMKECLLTIHHSLFASGQNQLSTATWLIAVAIVPATAMYAAAVDTIDGNSASTVSNAPLMEARVIPIILSFWKNLGVGAAARWSFALR